MVQLEEKKGSGIRDSKENYAGSPLCRLSLPHESFAIIKSRISSHKNVDWVQG